MGMTRGLWQKLQSKSDVPLTPDLYEFFQRRYANEPDTEIIEVIIEEQLPLMAYLARRQPVEPRGSRRQAVFARQVRLARFIVGGRCVSKSGRGGRVTFDWPKLAERWNLEHPHNHVTPANLKRNYYNAIKRPDVHEVVFVDTLRPRNEEDLATLVQYYERNIVPAIDSGIALLRPAMAAVERCWALLPLEVREQLVREKGKQ